MTQPTTIVVADDLILTAPDGEVLTAPMAPCDALRLAEDLTRVAFRKMLIEEAVADDERRYGPFDDAAQGAAA